MTQQVGGDHYAAPAGEAHWDRMWRMYGEAWFVGNVTKYVERYKQKNGMEDLLKARSYLDKLIELEEGQPSTRQDQVEKQLEQMIEPVNPLQACWDLVGHYVGSNAKHKTKGYELGGMNWQEIQTRLEQEVKELRDELGNSQATKESCAKEFADIFGCFIHLWLKTITFVPPVYLHQMLKYKLEIRFDLPPMEGVK